MLVDLVDHERQALLMREALSRPVEQRAHRRAARAAALPLTRAAGLQNWGDLVCAMDSTDPRERDGSRATNLEQKDVEPNKEAPMNHQSNRLPNAFWREDAPC